MKFGTLLLAGILLLTVPIHSNALVDTSAENLQAKVYLKTHLRSLNERYPFSVWDNQLRRLKSEWVKSQAGRTNSESFDSTLRPQFIRYLRALDSIRIWRPHVEKLMQAMYVQMMTRTVDSLFRKDGKTLSAEGRKHLYLLLKPYEAGSLRPKTDFLSELMGLDRAMNENYSSWIFSWAGSEFPRQIEIQVQANAIPAHEKIKAELNLKIDFWSRLIESDAAQALHQLKELQSEYNRTAPEALKSLNQLRLALQPDMLFSALLELAQRKDIAFTVEAEEKVERALKERRDLLLKPVEDKNVVWKKMGERLHFEVKRAAHTEDRQHRLAAVRMEKEQVERKRLDDAVREHEAKERIELERRNADLKKIEAKAKQEQARMLALEAEQQRAEETQREQLRQTLNSWKTLQTSGLSDLEGASKGILATKIGTLKTSTIGSGRVHLQVQNQKFSDTLALVEKFKVADNRLDLSNLSIDQKASQSSYVYASNSGRTSIKDLDQFIRQVALGSFEAYYRFLSYSAPTHWKPGSALKWQADHAPIAQVKDREFSYVDLVVDAHRKRSGNSSTRQKVEANVPANVIVIFDESGGIRRHQSFSSVKEVVIKSQDLSKGILRYKFLNYSADRKNIYLNGIDAEIKTSAPNS